MSERVIVTSTQKIKFKITPNEIFSKKLRLKDKYNNIIDISNWNFKGQFIKNYLESDIVINLTTTNEKIVIRGTEGELIFNIPSDITGTLLESDSGKFIIKYNKYNDDEHWSTLLDGKWNVNSDYFIVPDPIEEVVG